MTRDLVAAARALMSLVDEAGARAGKYAVDVRGAQGVQIGDHTRQDNVFHAPARRLSWRQQDRPRNAPEVCDER